MYPEDRVLVAFVPSLKDFELVRSQRWYRIPKRHVPKGLFAEYLAFYFGRQFGPEKWAIYYYARNLGHELVTRADLLPDQLNHPRADELYYKVQLGPLISRNHPIVSLRWRRITFIHTTWDRFMDAREINDLFVEGGQYVDRLYATLKERGIHAERNYRVSEQAASYVVPLLVPCQEGQIRIMVDHLPRTDQELARLTEKIVRETAEKGGVAFAAGHI